MTVTSTHKSTCLSQSLEGATYAVRSAAFMIALTVFAVAHPILGPLGSIACLFAAAYHRVCINYHLSRTREKDQKGNFIPGTEINKSKAYTNKETNYTINDIFKLRHEKERLYHVAALDGCLLLARILAKCTIPIIGPIWALNSETRSIDNRANYECSPDNINYCDWRFSNEQQQLSAHIYKLEHPKV
jgi:hypothetical protein